MVKYRSCCFTGHRNNYLPAGGDLEAPAMRELSALLKKAILRACELECLLFYAGGAEGFDMLAAECVLEVREKKYPNIKLCLALPSKTHASIIPESLHARYNAILAAADQVYYASESNNTAASMFDRNRYMVDHAALCIAYLVKNSGGTLYTVNYANQRGVPVLNLAQQIKS